MRPTKDHLHTKVEVRMVLKCRSAERMRISDNSLKELQKRNITENDRNARSEAKCLLADGVFVKNLLLRTTASERQATNNY